jgi:hypothetical protein
MSTCFIPPTWVDRRLLQARPGRINNHAEFAERRDLDARMLGLARDITRIAFEHNLIIVWKGENRHPSAFVGRDAHSPRG